MSHTRRKYDPEFRAGALSAPGMTTPTCATRRSGGSWCSATSTATAPTIADRVLDAARLLGLEDNATAAAAVLSASS